jgi:thiol-disulfide isomerase/thioredoxin
MKPLVEGLEPSYKDKIEFRRLNVESDQQSIALAEKLGVQYVPTFVFVNSNGVISKTVVGEMTKDAITSSIGGLR